MKIGDEIKDLTDIMHHHYNKNNRKLNRRDSSNEQSSYCANEKCIKYTHAPFRSIKESI